MEFWKTTPLMNKFTSMVHQKSASIDNTSILWHFVACMSLTPKVFEAIFQAFLKFGQAIVDAMFVQKISNFWW
jgi:hypothetical protein